MQTTQALLVLATVVLLSVSVSVDAREGDRQRIKGSQHHMSEHDSYKHNRSDRYTRQGNKNYRGHRVERRVKSRLRHHQHADKHHARQRIYHRAKGPVQHRGYYNHRQGYRRQGYRLGSDHRHKHSYVRYGYPYYSYGGNNLRRVHRHGGHCSHNYRRYSSAVGMSIWVDGIGFTYVDEGYRH